MLNNLHSCQEMQAAGELLMFGGDGRFDSIGFMAAFCTYFIMVCFSMIKIIINLKSGASVGAYMLLACDA